MRLPLRGIIQQMMRTFRTVLFVGALAGMVGPVIPSFANPAPQAGNDAGGELQIGGQTLADGVAIQSTRLQDVLIHAISLIGVKYQYGGNSAHSGFDCSGFVRHVFAESIALDLPRSSYLMGKRGMTVADGDLQPGDLVFYNTLRRSFSHVGIYLGEGRFVHSPSRGKAIEIVDMSEAYWRKRFNGARRIVGE